MPADDPPTKAELAFLATLPRETDRYVPRAYARWAQQVRAEWAASRPVVVEKPRKPTKRHAAPPKKWGGLDD